MATLNGTTVLFGGAGKKIALPRDTWTWDGTTWTMHMVPGPPGRIAPAMATLGGTVVLFGGFDTDGKALDDTWTWDGSGWTRRNAAPHPRGRYVSTMASLGRQ